MEEKVYEINPENCIYRENAYTEHDTGYAEYDCELMMYCSKSIFLNVAMAVLNMVAHWLLNIK